jgi:hypothetical protein
MKSKKERVGDDIYSRTPVSQFITPTASKLRKDAQAKALAAEKAAVVETEIQEEERVVEEEETKIKKKRKMEEEEEDERELEEGYGGS